MEDQISGPERVQKYLVKGTTPFRRAGRNNKEIMTLTLTLTFNPKLRNKIFKPATHYNLNSKHMHKIFMPKILINIISNVILFSPHTLHQVSIELPDKMTV